MAEVKLWWIYFVSSYLKLFSWQFSILFSENIIPRFSIFIFIKTQNIFLDNLAVVLSQRINGIYPHFLTSMKLLSVML